MPGVHCGVCGRYERQVMEAAGRPVAADVKPCDSFVLSDDFRAWLVEQMRREVMAQVSVAGLDRMAIVKGKKAAEPDPARSQTEASEGQTNGHARPETKE